MTTVGEIVTARLRADFAVRRHGAAIIARWCDCALRTAKGWIAGEATPRADELVSLCAANPGLHAEIETLILRRRAEIQERLDLAAQTATELEAALRLRLGSDITSLWRVARVSRPRYIETGGPIVNTRDYWGPCRRGRRRVHPLLPLIDAQMSGQRLSMPHRSFVHLAWGKEGRA